jgi:Holliday junction DNA helicase RuvB
MQSLTSPRVWDLFLVSTCFAFVVLAWMVEIWVALGKEAIWWWLLPGAGMVLVFYVASQALAEFARFWFRRREVGEPDTIGLSLCYHGREDEVAMESVELDSIDVQEMVYRTLTEHPGWAGHLEEMVAWEEAHPHTIDPATGYDSWLGWGWHDVHTSPAICHAMVSAGLLNVFYQSRSRTGYELRSLTATREALSMLRSVPTGTPPGTVNVKDLFQLVVGHERAKTLLTYALQAEQPVHVLLTGPPGTAKTLLLADIGRLPGAAFYVGSTTTKAGLVGLLLRSQPRYLVLDEVDKMDASDLTPLLNLMESGVVTRLQFKAQERMTLSTRVFATANNPEKLSAPILSRFLKIDIPPYTPAEFVQVAQAVLVQREGLGPQMARLVADEVVRYSTDIREAVRAARMAKNQPQAVPAIVRMMFDGQKERVARFSTVPKDGGR